MLHLLRKYNRSVPRYTSYPTVPQWKETEMEASRWTTIVKKAFEKTRDKGISLYIHLPYCEQLCTYCACNKRITTNHGVEQPYIQSVIRELEIYIDLFGSRPKIREIHLGGGTPTFFSPENLSSMMQKIRNRCDIDPRAELSFEGHPNNTSFEHLSTLYAEGFRRVSFGIQDLNEQVQIAINRIQPFENIERVTRWSREIGYQSVNFDFVYGLPFQNSKNLAITLQTGLKLKPDRVAFYSYAHVPWTSGGQRAYDESNLPSPLEKANMYLLGRKMFRDRNYIDIGMDHFAQPEDGLSVALKEGRLHRNFMGYTEAPGEFLLGLGASSISDAITAYSQNEKKVETYMQRLESGELPITRGHFLTVKEQSTRKFILNIACQRTLEWDTLQASQIQKLEEMSTEGIIELNPNRLKITDKGILFLRNICAVFDPYLQNDIPANTYSKAV